MEKDDRAKWISVIPVIILVVIFSLYVLSMTIG